MTDVFKDLLEKIKNKKAVVGIMGIGYVGENLGKYISEAGYKTIGFDVLEDRVDKLNQKNIRNFTATSDMSKLKDCDVITISVPTSATEDKKPILEPIIKVSEDILKNIKKGQLIILESTVSPGTTEEIIMPILLKSGLKAEEDLFFGFSPQRIDFGNPKYTIKQIPKVVAGLDKKSKELVVAFYSSFLDKIVPVSTLKAAEMCKILENTFRFVNINLINELTEYCQKRGIDMWEVIDAAKTKPFGFFAFYPSPGIAGHCIPIDPYYLLDDAQKHDMNLTILETSGGFHDERIKRLIKLIEELLKDSKSKNLLILGITVKVGSDDMRESIAMKIWEVLEKKGINISYHDKYRANFDGKKSVDVTKDCLEKQDLIVILTEHEDVDYNLVLSSKKSIIDTKNVYKKKEKNVIKF